MLVLALVSSECKCLPGCVLVSSEQQGWRSFMLKDLR